MKLIIFFSLFFSLSALACPDIAGTWECQESPNDFGHGRVKIEIKTKKGVPVYTFTPIDSDGDGSEKIAYIVDGKKHKLKKEKIPYIASCNENKNGQKTLVIDSKWESGGDEYYFLQEYTLDSDKKMSARLNQNVWKVSDETVVCDKVN